MSKFNDLPSMPEVKHDLPVALRASLPDQSMRCGGCGAKLAAAPLQRVLAKLPKLPAEHVQLGIGDDAAELAHCGESTLMSVDGFRALVDDPYQFGRIAAHHALNDIFAMAGVPHGALAFVTVPLMAEALMEEELFQLLSGVCDVLHAHQVPLVGGHSAEGSELTLGLTVTGYPSPQTPQIKTGMQVGDALILTKPLGTGVILAAAMSGVAASTSIEAALASMNHSNAAALHILTAHELHGLTDVTGFGLLGHLAQMLSNFDLGVCLNLQQIPTLPGAAELIVQQQSSLQQANEQAWSAFGRDPVALSAAEKLLVDPQTSGGLLASVAPGSAPAILAALGEAGYSAAVVGEVCAEGWLVQ